MQAKDSDLDTRAGAALLAGGIGLIGAGRIARALADGWHAAGLPVRAVASRSPASAARLASRVPGCAVCASPAEVLAQADLVFLTVPDDAIGPVADTLVPRAGQAIVHCSGASEVSLLAAAAAHGARIGGFHPLYLFAGLDDDAQRLRGCAVAIEAEGALDAALHRLAQALGCTPLRVPPGARLIYHAGAGYAASFLLALLDEAVRLWRAIGFDEDQARAALLPLARGTLDAVAAKGLSGALAGPVSRGDAGIVGRQIDALGALVPDGASHAQRYAALTHRLVDLARARGPAQPDAAALERILGLTAFAVVTGEGDGNAARVPPAAARQGGEG